MKKSFLPYYLSRGGLSLLFALLVFGFSWQGLLFALVLFALFLLYLHSGWFSVDENNPFFPLRRDAHAQSIQRKALIAAIVVGLLTYLGLYFGLAASLSVAETRLVSGNITLAVAVIAYFVSQFVLFSRT